MNRRSFLGALALAPFLKWAYRQAKPVPKGWFIAQFKYAHKAWDGYRDIIIFKKDVDKPMEQSYSSPH